MSDATTIKVRTASRLYRGAKLEIAPGVFRRVVREDASRWSSDAGWTTIVEVEPTLVCVGDWTIDAAVKP
jgi:hypothetical protein